MKTFIKRILFITAAAFTFWACEKDETKAVLKTGVTPSLSASSSAITLLQADADSNILTLNWNSVDYGFDAAISYSLQISKAGSNFASANTTEVSLTYAQLKKAFTAKELNGELLKILPAGVTSQVEVRMKANAAGILSNVLQLSVTPYRDLILYNYPLALNVAGNYQEWNPATAPQVVSIANDGKYEGFINFQNATPQFKYVKGNDWAFGDLGSAGAGTGKLQNGGDNLSLSQGEGIYYITANTNTLVWTNYKVNSWGLIGDATPNGWDSDQNMTYDAATGIWSVTVDLIAGKIKFRANDDWAVNLGDKGNNGTLEVGGDDIPHTTPGNYTVSLDVSVGGNWSYSLKKN